MINDSEARNNNLFIIINTAYIPITAFKQWNLIASGNFQLNDTTNATLSLLLRGVIPRSPPWTWPNSFRASFFRNRYIIYHYCRSIL